jgi:hypothetical protein
MNGRLRCSLHRDRPNPNHRVMTMVKAMHSIGPVRPASTISVQADRDASAVVTLVTIALVIANILVWTMVATGS